LQTSDIKGKGSAAGGGFIAIAACDGNDKAAALRTVDCHGGIRTEQIRDGDITD